MREPVRANVSCAVRAVHRAPELRMRGPFSAENNRMAMRSPSSIRASASPPRPAPPAPVSFHAVLLGEAGVGKTNLLTQFVKGEFMEGQESTIGGTRPMSLSAVYCGR